MKVVLARPDHHSHLIQPPLALGYLAAYLRREGHQVKAIDGVNEGLSNDQIVDRCAQADLVGFSILSDYYPQCVDAIKKLKARGIKVVVGGPHVTVIPIQTLEETGADFAVTSEGEPSVAALAANLEMGGDGQGVPGVVTLENPTPEVQPLIKDLGDLPFPDWDDMPPATYPPAPHGGVAKNYPIVPVTSSRGCPYNCSFCSSPFQWRRKIRFRPPENVVDEIAYMVSRYGVREVHFEDDNLTMKRAHAAAIAEGILRKGIKVSWATPNGIRADKVDRELLSLMQRSGLYSVAFGIESADPEVLQQCNKKASVEKYTAAINIAAELGIMTQGFFIFGLPGETPQSIQRTIDFACNSRLDKAQFLLLDVMPGTEIWDQIEPKPDLTSYQSYHDVTWCPPGVSPEVLKAAQAQAFRTFFLSKPRRVVKMISLIKPRQWRYVMRRLLDFRIIPSRD